MTSDPKSTPSSHKSEPASTDVPPDRTENGSLQPGKSRHAAFDATIALDATVGRSTKEERDIAFAIAAM